MQSSSSWLSNEKSSPAETWNGCSASPSALQSRLMHRFGAQPLGNALVLDRKELIRRLKAIRRGRPFSIELDRRHSLTETLRQARTHSIRVPVATDIHRIHLESLPDGVTLSPGRIEVAFTNPKEAVQRLYALAQALINDFDAFEKAVEVK